MLVLASDANESLFLISSFRSKHLHAIYKLLLRNLFRSQTVK